MGAIQQSINATLGAAAAFKTIGAKQAEAKAMEAQAKAKEEKEHAEKRKARRTLLGSKEPESPKMGEMLTNEQLKPYGNLVVENGQLFYDPRKAEESLSRVADQQKVIPAQKEALKKRLTLYRKKRNEMKGAK